MRLQDLALDSVHGVLGAGHTTCRALRKEFYWQPQLQRQLVVIVRPHAALRHIHSESGALTPGPLQSGRYLAWQVYLGLCAFGVLAPLKTVGASMTMLQQTCLPESLAHELQMAFAAGASLPVCLCQPLACCYILITSVTEAKVGCEGPKLGQLRGSGAAPPPAVQQWLASFKAQVQASLDAARAHPFSCRVLCDSSTGG